MKVLLITSSPNPASVSSEVARRALEAAGLVPFASIDTAVARPPAYDAHLMAGVYAGSKSDESLAALAVGDAYIDQLLEADVLVAAIAMHNFGVTSGFKAWMDQVARPGRTFQYGAAGPEGLLKGKKAILIASSGGDYTQGPYASYDHAASHVKAVLGFLGMDVQVIWASGQAGAGAGASKEAALAQAAAALKALAAA